MLFDPKPLKQSFLQVQTDLHALPDVLQWFEQFKRPPLSDDQWEKFQLILVEAFTNAVRHAHRELPKTTPIDIEGTLFKDSLTVVVWDYGQPFDLEKKLQSILEEETDPLERLLKENGRGLIWMKEITDELRYSRPQSDRNCLMMRKKIRTGL